MSSPLKAIIGLGNPGNDYVRTRHNAGFWMVERLAERYRGSFRVENKFHGELTRVQIAGQDLLLLKPSTFMNRSGLAAQALAQFYKLQPTDLLIAHDELDLPAGTARLKAGGGHGGHNGLRDLHRVFGDGYLRLRIGIGHPGDKSLVLNYVLGRPSKGDEDLIVKSIDDATDAVETWCGRGWERALNQLHSIPTPGKPGAGPQTS